VDRPPPRLRSVLLVVAIWTALALFFFSRGLTQRLLRNDPNPWWHHLVAWLLGCYAWALLTPAVLWLGRRFPIERAVWPGRLALHLLLSVVFSVLQAALESVASVPLGLFPSVMGTVGGAFPFLVVMALHGGMLTYWAVHGAQWAVRYYRGYEERSRDALALELRTSELSAQLSQARLSAMKMQLQPHFLFNTLNAVMVLVRKGEGRAAEATLARLGDLLRVVLEDGEAQEVPLERELSYLRLYLEIEEVRFGDRLRVEIAVADGLQGAAVPPLALQPIVENAIRHGLFGSADAGRLRIAAARVGDVLELRVEDDGPGFAPAAADGIGLTNTRARLAQLYGQAGRLVTSNRPGGGALVVVSLPYREVDVPGPVAEEHAALDARR
jgi:two-component system, LytTR family, sensor kinase